MAVLYRFSYLFNDDESTEEERFQGTIPQALMMMNGNFVSNGARAGRITNLGKILQSTTTYTQRLDDIFLTILSRYPDQKEYEQFSMLDGPIRLNKIRQGYEDMFWVLLNSPEFIVNH